MAMHYLCNHPNEKVLILTIPSLVKTTESQENGQFLNDWYDKLPFEAYRFFERVCISNDVYSNIEKYRGQKWGLIILDEAHRYLEAEKRREAVKGLRAEKVVFMTATPIKRNVSDLGKYCDLASIICGYEVKRDWMKEMTCHSCEGNNQSRAICEVFDEKKAVTRYFKDTVRALEHVKDGKIDYEKVKAIRKKPEVWEYPQECEKIKVLVDKIWENNNSKKQNGDKEKNRFVIFTRLIAGESDLIEKHLAMDEERFVKFSATENNTEDRMSYVSINGQSKEKIGNYTHNGTPEDGRERKLPDILIITYQIAEAGVNLPGYNYVINYHIPAYPAALEQRFGRIDRMGKKEGTQYEAVNMVYLLPKKGVWNTYKQNFYDAVMVYRYQLLTNIPAKNTILTSEIMKMFGDDLRGMEEWYQQLKALCEDTEVLNKAYQEVGKEEPKNKLAQFCKDHEIIGRDDAIEEIETFKDMILDKLGELEHDLKDNLKKLQRGENNLEVEKFFKEIEDKIYYFRDDASVSSIRAICSDTAVKDCAVNINESSSEYRDFVIKFNEEVRLPLIRQKYEKRIEEYFENQFLYSKVSDSGVEVAVGKFENIFVTDYAELLEREVFKEVAKEENDEVKLLLSNCTKEWINRLPFFRMCASYGKKIYDNCFVKKSPYGNFVGVDLSERYLMEISQTHILREAFNSLCEENKVPVRLRESKTYFESLILSDGWECTNWLKLAFHCLQNYEKNQIMDDIVEYTQGLNYLRAKQVSCHGDSGEMSQDAQVILQRKQQLMSSIRNKVGIDYGNDLFYHIFYTESGNWRAPYKAGKTSRILPRKKWGRGYTQIKEFVDYTGADLWTYCIFKMLLKESNCSGQIFGNSEWVECILEEFK